MKNLRKEQRTMEAHHLLSELPARCFRAIRRLAGAVGGRGGSSGGKTRLSHINKITRIMAIPDQRYSLDAARPVTPYEHLVKDYTEGGAGSRRRHFEEWVRYVDNVTDEFEAAQRVRHLMKIGYSIHFHVWTQVEMIEIVLNLKKKLKFEIELIYRNLKEVIFILRKTGS